LFIRIPFHPLVSAIDPAPQIFNVSRRPFMAVLDFTDFAVKQEGEPKRR